MPRAFPLVLTVAVILASLTRPAPTATQQSWTRGAVKATAIDTETEIKTASGNDAIRWTSTIQPAQLPDVLRVGDELRLQVNVQYRFGSGAGAGHPKRIRITITVGSRTADDKTFELVQDYCSNATARNVMPGSGTLSVPVAHRIEPADADLERLVVTVRVGVAIYCQEPEAHGTSELTVAYDRGAAAPAGNAAPTVTLATEPASRVFAAGEQFILSATATDDHDPPERLRYQWSVRNLDTGATRTAASTTSRRVRTRGRPAGKYEYKCVVTDTAGASGEATLAVAMGDPGDPAVESLTFDDSTGALHHVTPYWQESVPAIRRGEWALMLVSVRNFIAGPHLLKVYVDGTLVAKGGPGSAWAIQSAGGSTTQRRVRLFIPPDVAVGKHSLEVAAVRRGVDGNPDKETNRVAFSPEPLVLFNPWRSTLADVSVYGSKPLSNIRATFYARGTQDLVMSSLAWDSVYDVTPHDRSVVRLAQEIVNSMPEGDRADAGRVTTAMATYVGSRVLLGKWPSANSADPYPNAIKKPWEWRASSEICDAYLTGGQRVKYGQCWVFGFTLTGLLRSVGIPAREITVIGSGHDVEAEWGVLQTKYVCRKWAGTKCEDSSRVSAQEQWNFHAWNEVWVPSVNPVDGWAGADATPQGHAGGGDQFIGTPSLKAVRDFRPPPRGQQLPDADDAVFLYEETNLPWEILWELQDKSWFKASGGAATATHGFVSNAALQRTDELSNYGVTPFQTGSTARTFFDLIRGAFGSLVVPVSAQQASPLQITVGPIVNLRTPATIRVSASGLGAAPLRLGLGVMYLPRELSGGAPADALPGALVFGTVLDVRPVGGAWTGAVDIPADVLSIAGTYEVVVGPQQGATGPSGRARFDVRGLPIEVTLPARVAVGASFPMSARLLNSTTAPVRAATLRLVLPKQLRVVDGATQGTQDVIPPGGALRLDAVVQASSAGRFLAGAASESSVGPSEAHSPVVVSQRNTLFVAGEPALGVAVGGTVSLAANVILDALDPLSDAEARLGVVDSAAVTLVSDARQVTRTLEPDDRWTPSWQVRVTAPGTYRLPVTVAAAGAAEVIGEILLVAGSSDADDDAIDDFGGDDTVTSGSSPFSKTIIVVAVGVAVLVLAAIVVLKRRRTIKP